MKFFFTVSHVFLIIIASTAMSVRADPSKPITPQAQNQQVKAQQIKSPKLKPYAYNVFYKVYQGKVVYFEMIRTKDGLRRVKMYPYGKAKAKLGSARPIISSNKFMPYIRALAAKEKMAAKRPIKFSNTNNSKNEKGILNSRASSTPITSGLGMGYNTSTGYIGPESVCYNATTVSNNNQSSQNLSSSNTASSVADQYGASSSISGSYDGFRASYNFTFQDSYQNSGNAGQIYYNAYSTYQLTNTLQTSDPINSYGDAAQQAGTFTSDCGSSFVNSMTAGMLITSQFYWSSSSSSTSESINDQVTGSYTTLASTTDAISYATSQTSSSTTFNFITYTYGGGAQAVATMSAATSGNSNESTCLETGSSSACTSFFDSVQTAADTAISDFEASLPTNGDYSSFEVFPDGIAGASSNTQPIYYEPLNTLLSNSVTYTDELLPYTAQLNNYVTILNQISTLNQRASFVNGLVTQNYFNPSYFLNISYYSLNPLVSAYQADYDTLTKNLSSCLNYSATSGSSSSSSVQTACAPILNLYSQGITNAYQYYAAGGPSSVSSSSNQTLVQQNTIALQYTGTNTTTNLYPGNSINFACCNSQIPTDLVWTPVVNSTPTYQPNTSALIAFGDQVYPTVGSGQWTTSNAAFTQIISTNSNAPQNTMSIPVSSYVANDCTVTYSTIGYISCSSTMTYNYTNNCTAPTFGAPCGITGIITFPSSSSTITQTLNLGPIPNFFVE